MRHDRRNLEDSVEAMCQRHTVRLVEAHTEEVGANVTIRMEDTPLDMSNDKTNSKATLGHLFELIREPVIDEQRWLCVAMMHARCNCTWALS